MKFLPIPYLCTDDIVAAYIEIPGREGSRMIVCSAYLPGEESDPTKQITHLVTYSQEHQAELLVGCDSNSHHTSWGSTDTNARGESLFEFLMTNDLSVLNLGNNPTFVTSLRQEVLDITFSTVATAHRITNWHVSNEASMSDHRHIRYDLTRSLQRHVNQYRDPKTTNWAGYRDSLKLSLNSVGKSVKTLEQLEKTAGELEKGITSAYLHNCPLKTTSTNRNVPWWNKNLDRLRRKVRALFNKAKKEKTWDAYRKALTCFNKEIRKAKRRSWRKLCEQINGAAQTARIHKILSKAPSSHLGLLKKPDGTFTNSAEETLKILAEVHFPESVIIDREDKPLNHGIPVRRPKVEDWKRASMIFRPDRVEWAINSFKPYKTGGEDGIFPALLQKGADVILPMLLKVYRASYAWGYIPANWTKVVVIFIPKGGDRDKSQPKSYRPISLTSFMLKTMEKVINLYIRETYLVSRPLHAKQHAYQKGKSTESALMELVDKVEKAIEDKEIALCAFLDIEGAFDNTSTDVILKSMTNHNIDETTINWIGSMLCNRTASTSLLNSTIQMRLTRGCPQGGVLSPLEWSLVVDCLLRDLNDAKFDTQGYADDLVVIVTGKVPDTVSNLMQSALVKIERWCKEFKLNVNPGKTIIVPFTKRRKLQALKPPTLFGKTIQFSNEVKYLGIILDQKLTWNKHIQYVTKKAKIALGTCCRLVRLKWGLRPKSTLWLYTAIIRPMVTYGCVTWQRKTTQTTCVNMLNSVQRLACLIATSALSTSPTAALEALLNLTPLHLHVQQEAKAAMLRAMKAERTKWGSSTIRKLYDDLMHNPIVAMPSDAMMKQYSFQKLFKVKLPQREDWKDENPFKPKPGEIVWFTDGSKKEGLAGAGIYSGRPQVKRSIHLGRYATVFQAEVYAILECVHESLLRDYTGKNIVILSDSQAALKALTSEEIDSRLVLECVQVLNKLGSTNSVLLGWVPGHCGISGNEIADELAKSGAESHITGPDPVCGIPESALKLMLKEWGRAQAQKYWLNSPGQEHSKLLLSGFNKKYTDEALSMTRNHIRILARTLSGHCKLNKHSNRLGLTDITNCRFCRKEDETPIHILCGCEALLHSRSRHLGGYMISPEDIKALTPKVVVRFMLGVGLEEVL